MNSIGEKLSNLRKGKILSQEEAAESLGVTRQTISKWETDQSMPDFDKVTLICSLYGITPNELFGSKTQETKIDNKEKDNTSKRALGIASGILLYFIAVSWIVVSIAAFKMDPVLSTGIFLTICGIATVLIIYVSLAYKIPVKEHDKVKNPLQKSITECLGTLTCVIYFIISFVTMAWHLTWIIWLIYGLIEEIVKLLFVLKENKNEK